MQNHKYREGPTLQYARLATIILTQISKTTMYKPANEDVIAVMFVWHLPRSWPKLYKHMTEQDLHWNKMQYFLILVHLMLILTFTLYSVIYNKFYINIVFI